MMSWDILVSIMSSSGLDDQDLIPGRGRDFSLCCHVQSACRAIPTLPDVSL